DPDRQSLLVWYPTVTPVEGYIRQAVKIESGAKSALDPNCETTIRPYLADDVASLNLDLSGITTVVAERTFWDKVIIIHGQRRWFERRGELQNQGQRVSRYYYDIYRLLESPVGQRALEDRSLSRDCVRHARMFFDRADFDLASAIPGTLVLSPSLAMADFLRRDYARMAGMIMGAVPEFDEVIARIEDFERAINASI
ncbi:MAG: nucleotidyl transferase AbiEii/AbiGii toxin family protein, partial [Acidobacteria bacterium]|nr:nucleotidyl transferase AbiEii/AbiGii toxin family protein [Acidobacteriota bacterium]